MPRILSHSLNDAGEPPPAPGTMSPVERDAAIRAGLLAGQTAKALQTRLGGHNNVYRKVRECLLREGWTPPSIKRSSGAPTVRLTPAATAHRLALHEKGMNDQEIGEAVGVGRSDIREWRRRQGLSVHRSPNAKHTPAQRAARMLLYSLGWSDRQIAREQHLCYTTVTQWRTRLGLVPNGGPTFRRRSRIKKYNARNCVLTAIKRAVGRALPPDIADDAVADLCLAVLDGTIPIDQIEAEARKFGNRVLSQFASKFGPRSLDEELGDDDGFRMIDLVRDERSASWLEEMGATVW
jgi:transposase